MTKYKYSRKEIVSKVKAGCVGWFVRDDIYKKILAKQPKQKSTGKGKDCCRKGSIQGIPSLPPSRPLTIKDPKWTGVSRPTLQPIEKVKPSMLNYPSEMEAIVCLVRDVFEKQQEVIDRINLLSEGREI